MNYLLPHLILWFYNCITSGAITLTYPTKDIHAFSILNDATDNIDTIPQKQTIQELFMKQKDHNPAKHKSFEISISHLPQNDVYSSTDIILDLTDSQTEWFPTNYKETIYSAKNATTNYNHSHYFRSAANSTHDGGRSQFTKCFYEGTIRSIPGSWLVLDNCDRTFHFNGIINDGEDFYYMQPMQSESSNILRVPHLLSKYQKIVENDTAHGNYTKNCEIANNVKLVNSPPQNYKTRRKRDLIVPEYQGHSPLVIELYIVNDHSQYVKWGKDERKVILRTLQISHILNAIFKQLNILVALVGTEVWTSSDRITILSDGDKTLKNFNAYRQKHILPVISHDNAQLLTAHYFDGGVIGKAIKRQICAYSDSTGVAMDHNNLVGPVASTMAHELGHSLGMDHDTEICDCPDRVCVMTPASGSFLATKWSSCSLQYLSYSIARGMDACLGNVPAKVLDTPKCGNGFLESEGGEECDCGLPEYCQNKCCNPVTCKLSVNSSCATGSCCNFFTCQLRPAASVCRRVNGVCDLPEFCDGKSEFCPRDIHVQDAMPCPSSNSLLDLGHLDLIANKIDLDIETNSSNNDKLLGAIDEDPDLYTEVYSKGHCFYGQCQSYASQCKLIWGTSAKMAVPTCFKQNAFSDNPARQKVSLSSRQSPSIETIDARHKNGDCGYDIVSTSFTSCPNDDYMCGRVHCVDEAERPIYGDTSGRKEWHSYVRYASVTKPFNLSPRIKRQSTRYWSCHSVFIDLGSQVKDAGMTPDGATCGPEKVCVNRSCIHESKVNIRKCRKNCSGHGICNSENNCHCYKGYGPPYCDKPGIGGSINSGPPANITRIKPFIKALLLLFLCFVPSICLMTYCVYKIRTRYGNCHKRRTYDKNGRDYDGPHTMTTFVRNVLTYLFKNYKSKNKEYDSKNTADKFKKPEKLANFNKQNSLTSQHIHHVFMEQKDNKLLKDITDWPLTDRPSAGPYPLRPAPPPPPAIIPDSPQHKGSKDARIMKMPKSEMFINKSKKKVMQDSGSTRSKRRPQPPLPPPSPSTSSVYQNVILPPKIKVQRHESSVSRIARKFEEEGAIAFQKPR
ncbi:disintegrin and metalloproteinase domain-containing protein 12-like isoform X2 [Gordionus sp. m RMFG-2023]|uniref:disintegrin and metalloproteinase domain-containing protein 12-like isoform X2 n=1 Tax=Gordionus sp. m RMFG-2023 TaxID=3053472 RepID=UPI0031FC0D18